MTARQPSMLFRLAPGIERLYPKQNLYLHDK